MTPGRYQPADAAGRVVRRACVGGRVDVCGRSHTRKKRPEEERVPGPCRSHAKPFCNSISGFLKMSHRFDNTPNAVNNDVQVRAAAGSHHLPTPWPWPHRWAWVGTGCRRDVRDTSRCWSFPKILASRELRSLLDFRRPTVLNCFGKALSADRDHMLKKTLFTHALGSFPHGVKCNVGEDDHARISDECSSVLRTHLQILLKACAVVKDYGV